MQYICPKCGKKMDLSAEVLINSNYTVICPQCLSQLQIVGDYAYIPHDSLELDHTVESSSTINCPNCGASFDTPSPSTTATDAAPEDVTVLPPPLPASDPLYNDALQYLMTCTAITPMMLRDHFHISNERAAELIRQLEAGGAIGPYNHGGPRQILIPHRSLYEYTSPQENTAGRDQATQGQPLPRRRMGCFTWLLLIMLLTFLMKACGA